MKIKLKNDTIEWRFWETFLCLVTNRRRPRFFRSQIYEYEFNSFSDYWIEIGKRGALVQFISSKVPGKYGPKSYFTEEIAQRIARLDLGENPGVVIMNIDQSKLDRLMLMFAGIDPNIFRLGEMVVLPTNSKEAAYKLTLAIPVTMADVIAFSGGYMICDNNHVE